MTEPLIVTNYVWDENTVTIIQAMMWFSYHVWKIPALVDVNVNLEHDYILMNGLEYPLVLLLMLLLLLLSLLLSSPIIWLLLLPQW